MRTLGPIQGHYWEEFLGWWNIGWVWKNLSVVDESVQCSYIKGLGNDFAFTDYLCSLTFLILSLADCPI